MEVATGAGLPPASQLGLQATVYGPLSSRSAFEQTLSSAEPTSTALGSTGVVTLGGLVGVPAPAGTSARYRIAVGLEAGGSAPSGTVTGQVVNLGCSPGSCVGVYPVVVSLRMLHTGRQLSRFTTFVTYASGSIGSALRVAVVLPIQGPLARARAAGGGTAVLSTTQLTNLSDVASTLDRSPTAVTLQPVPATLQRLAVSGAAGRATLGALQLAAAQPAHQFIGGPYEPISAAALAASGLGSEIARQVAGGQRVLSDLGLPASVQGPWVATGGVNEGAAQAAAALHATQLVVPASSLAPVPEKLTNSYTFSLPLGHGTSITAASADTGFTRLFVADPHDPVLAASQLLAELNLTYLEQPAYLRGVVVVPPPGWQPDAAFVATLLQGMAPGTDPDLAAVTLTTFFATVPRPPASSDQPAHRQLAASTAGAPLPSSFVASLRASRSRWSAFSSAVQGAQATLEQLDDTLLTSEAQGLSLHARIATLQGFRHDLDTQLAKVQLATDRTITLTARKAALPVTILSSAPYRIVGVLALKSDKLLFPDGAVHQVVLDRSTTPVRVEVEARTSGDLPVQVTVLSPSGGLVLVHGRLTVRSTATSAVGVVLTLAALAVLLGWWGRTSLAKRRGRARRRRRADGGSSRKIRHASSRAAQH